MSKMYLEDYEYKAISKELKELNTYLRAQKVLYKDDPKVIRAFELVDKIDKHNDYVKRSRFFVIDGGRV